MAERDRARIDVLIIGGFGRVGLPLGITLADAGFRVLLHDVDASKRPLIEAGRMPFIEHEAEPMLQRVIGKTLRVAQGLADVAKAETVIITIGTPVDQHLNPMLKPMLELAEAMGAHLRDGQTVILRSTVFPGTTQRLQERFARRGLRVHLAYCPERIVQGEAIRELRTLTQIVSGCTEPAVLRAEALFQRLGVSTIRVTVQEAELAKLFSNAWRYIQFATANQFYMMATEQGADYARIYHAMTHRYERARDIPRPGFAAGPCLLKDTLQLAAFQDNQFPLGHAAMMVNEGLPRFLVRYLTETRRLTLAGARVGVLGMAFKANIDDTRDSLSYKLAKILRFHGAEVVCSDEHVQDPAFVSKETLIATCPIVIVGVPHAAYRQLAVPADTELLDLWGMLRERPAKAAAAPKGRPRARRREPVTAQGR